MSVRETANNLSGTMRGLSRRRVLGGSLGALAGAAMWAVGVHPAKAGTDVWVVAAGASGEITQDWHTDWYYLGAIDIGASGGNAVALYARKNGTSTYGWFECIGLGYGCDYPSNINHRYLKFRLAKSSSDPWFGECAYVHVEPYSISYGATGTAYRQIAYVGSGTSYIAGCYTGQHLHQSGNGTRMWVPAEGSAADPASAGNNSFWYWYA